MPRDDENHKEHKFKKAIEAQLDLLREDQLKLVMGFANSLIVTGQPPSNQGYGKRKTIPEMSGL